MTYTIEDLQELHDNYGYFEIVGPYQSPDNGEIFQEEWHLFVGWDREGTGARITGETLQECLDKFWK